MLLLVSLSADYGVSGAACACVLQLLQLLPVLLVWCSLVLLV